MKLCMILLLSALFSAADEPKLFDVEVWRDASDAANASPAGLLVSVDAKRSRREPVKVAVVNKRNKASWTCDLRRTAVDGKEHYYVTTSAGPAWPINTVVEVQVFYKGNVSNPEPEPEKYTAKILDKK